MGSIVDFHTHILPKLDDGSSSVDVSLAMLREECRQGINKLVLTPHFYANHDSPERFLERRNKSFETLRKAVDGIEEIPDFVLGAEVKYFDGISDCDDLGKLCIDGTDCVLIELPFRKWDDRMLLELASIYPKRRILPIIAHVDRYALPFREREVFDRISSLPVKIQVNSEFFLRLTSRRAALKMLSEGKIHFLGSDCHNMTVRKPNIASALEAIESRLGDFAVEQIIKNQKQINI